LLLLLLLLLQSAAVLPVAALESSLLAVAAVVAAAAVPCCCCWPCCARHRSPLLRLRIVLVTDSICRRCLIALFRLRGWTFTRPGFGPRCATTGPPPLVAGFGPDFARKITRCHCVRWSCEREDDVVESRAVSSAVKTFCGVPGPMLATTRSRSLPLAGQSRLWFAAHSCQHHRQRELLASMVSKPLRMVTRARFGGSCAGVGGGGGGSCTCGCGSAALFQLFFWSSRASSMLPFGDRSTFVGALLVVDRCGLCGYNGACWALPGWDIVRPRHLRPTRAGKGPRDQGQEVAFSEGISL